MYQALYRKYRPSSFNEVIGQEVIIKTLKNAVNNQQVSHAYMFFGPRGTGKTSIAKLLARSVNCNDPDEGNICEQCEMCNVSRETECVDIIEIDAASNNGVDEIRELRNKVNLVPASLKYKVYIIDEVHMLTTGAFNALLKTLEEPPKHIIFILATTDPQKVPETIISRCQCFNFKRISEQEIVNRLTNIVEKEKIEIDNEVLFEIARISDGGMRDSVSALDQLKSYTNNKITIDDFIEVNGILNKKQLKLMIEYIILGNIKELISLLEEFNSKGKNLIQIMIQLLNYLRNIIVDSYINNDITVNNADNYISLAEFLNEKMFDIKKSENPKIYIEIMLISYLGNKKIISREIISTDNLKESEVKSEVEENKIEKTGKSVENVETDHNEMEKSIKSEILISNAEIVEKKSKQKIANINEILNVRINNTFSKASKNELEDDKTKFLKLKEYTFDQEIGYLVCELLDGNIRVSSENTMIISYEYDSMLEKALVNIEQLERTMRNILNINKSLALISNNRWEEEKVKFIKNKKENVLYEIQSEPEIIYIKEETLEPFHEVVDLFSDIIEVE